MGDSPPRSLFGFAFTGKASALIISHPSRPHVRAAVAIDPAGFSAYATTLQTGSSPIQTTL